MKRVNRLLLIYFLILNVRAGAQDMPNNVNDAPLSGSSNISSKMAGTPINLYTGIPSISFPIYHYAHHNGLALDVSLDFFGGGAKINEIPSPEGVNWFLNAGGQITRTVRGMPDDLYPNGYLFGSVLPSSDTVNASKYYHDSLDAEMDVYQFNFNGRSGNFYIGKNKQIIQTTLSRLRIAYDTSGGGISQFQITTEDGVKYYFRDVESTKITSTQYKFGYSGKTYATGWFLSMIIAPFATDTIKFLYNSASETSTIVFPQTVYVDNSNHSNTQTYSPTGTQVSTVKKLAYIIFPDKRNVNFVYDCFKRYDLTDSVLNRIKIGDSVVRYGYLMDWGFNPIDSIKNARAYLTGIRYFTPTAIMPGYKFGYHYTIFPALDSSGNYGYSRDHWGFYNGASNGTNAIPSVTGLYTGANRNPSATYAISSTLDSVTDPRGGVTRYKFESNDLPQYTIVPQEINLNALSNTSTNITLSQVVGNQYTFYVIYDLYYGNNGILTGSCGFTCKVTSLDGLTTYGSITTTIYQLATGVHFSFVAPNGNYLFTTTYNSCSSNLGSLPIDVDWQNQTLGSGNMLTGGVRLRQESHYDPTTGRTDTLATYIYNTSDGRSSGFLGATPIYTYPYKQTVINGTTVTTNFTAITSNPSNDLNYTQGSPVGYSHVEVLRGSLTHNIGKQVYEFNNSIDAGSGLNSPFFPFVPIAQRNWYMGLPKKISAYDSTGKMIKTTQNYYNDSIVSTNSSNFQSRKFGKVSTTYYGPFGYSTTPTQEFYTAVEYFPEFGRSFLFKSIDSVYHSDNSLQTVTKFFQYDTNYNVIKITSPYDPTRGLSLEDRFYYPYNYTITGAIGKLRDSGIVNTLIAEEKWITGDANPRILNGNIFDFSQLPSGHIKPLTLYGLQSNSPILQSTIGTFNSSSLVRNATYFVPQRSFATYDNQGNLLETKDAQSGVSNSVVLDYFNQFEIATVSNAKQSDVAYTSFESDGTGNWTVAGSGRSTTQYLTGKKSYDLSGGNVSKTGLSSSQSYLVSLWVYTGATVSVNGSALSTVLATQNNWRLFQVTLTSITTVTISGSGLIDELRLHPKDANMITNTYEPLIGKTSSADANNEVNYLAYDPLNRLKLVKDKDLNILKKYEYSDNTSSISIVPNWVGTGTSRCNPTTFGQIDSSYKDVNPYSETFNVIKWVNTRFDCTGVCKPPCTSPYGKIISCSCQAGTRMNVSCVHTKINGTTWVWRCTYQYCYPDGSSSSLYTEDNASACTVNGGCVN